MTIEDVKDRISWFEEEVADFFADGASIERLHRIELARKDLIAAIEGYKVGEKKMTIEEIEKLIEEYGDACAEWQAYIDEQFEDDNPIELKHNVNNTFNKLIEAIKQYKEQK